MDQQLKDWHDATGNLPYGVQRVFLETLHSVKDEDIRLTYGADYGSDNSPCLVNTVAPMLTHNEQGVNPMREFPAVVRAFDSLNNHLYAQGVNTEPRRVSPLAAEILIRNFGPLKPEPDEAYLAANVAELSHGVYIEKSDEELTQDWINSMREPINDDSAIRSIIEHENI